MEIGALIDFKQPSEMENFIVYFFFSNNVKGFSQWQYFPIFSPLDEWQRIKLVDIYQLFSITIETVNNKRFGE